MGGKSFTGPGVGFGFGTGCGFGIGWGFGGGPIGFAGMGAGEQAAAGSESQLIQHPMVQQLNVGSLTKQLTEQPKYGSAAAMRQQLQVRALADQLQQHDDSCMLRIQSRTVCSLWMTFE
eukprot:GHUV01014138.1.p3 GENE.GHUV01014138.1~~GHUV01014138.1.p3  ORF type:complete len:119 (+),score=30.56 GHUV01014138.1:474-830(+)